MQLVDLNVKHWPSLGVQPSPWVFLDLVLALTSAFLGLYSLIEELQKSY